MTHTKRNVLFVLLTYGLFWLVLLLAWFGMQTGMMPSEELTMHIVTIVAAWMPTVAVLILRKRLFPGSTIKSFYKNAFRDRLNWGLIICTTAVQILVIIGTVGAISLSKGEAFCSMFNLAPQSLIISGLWLLPKGPMGEETGWRGFLQPSLEKNSSVIRASVFTGIIWGFFHSPFWFLLSGYSGTDLLRYIVAFMVSIIAFSVMIGICQRRCNNLLIPVWMHFLHNFLLSAVFVGNLIDAWSWTALFSVFSAAGYIVWYKKTHIIRETNTCG